MRRWIGHPSLLLINIYGSRQLQECLIFIGDGEERNTHTHKEKHPLLPSLRTYEVWKLASAGCGGGNIGSPRLSNVKRLLHNAHRMVCDFGMWFYVSAGYAELVWHPNWYEWSLLTKARKRRPRWSQSDFAAKIFPMELVYLTQTLGFPPISCSHS